MSPVTLRLFAAGNSPWVMLDRLQQAFSVGLEVVPSAGAVLAAKVQLSFDRTTAYDSERSISITRVAGLATVTDIGHGLTTGDSAIIYGTNSGAVAGTPGNLDTLKGPLNAGLLPGTYGVDVTVVDTNTYTYAVGNTGVLTANGIAKYLRVADHATLGAVTARANGNVAFNVMAVRLQVSSLTTGILPSVDFIVLQGSDGYGVR